MLPQHFSKESLLFSTLSLQGTSLAVLLACLYCFFWADRRTYFFSCRSFIMSIFFFFPHGISHYHLAYFFMLLGTNSVTQLCWNRLQHLSPSSSHTYIISEYFLHTFVCFGWSLLTPPIAFITQWTVFFHFLSHILPHFSLLLEDPFFWWKKEYNTLTYQFLSKLFAKFSNSLPGMKNIP